MVWHILGFLGFTLLGLCWAMASKALLRHLTKPPPERSVFPYGRGYYSPAGQRWFWVVVVLGLIGAALVLVNMLLIIGGSG